MADNIEQISLSFTLPSTSGSGAGATVGGTIDVDYTMNTVSMTITASTGPGNTEQFSTYTLTNPSTNNYTISATGNSSAANTLSFSYAGQGPSAINNVALALTGANYAASSEPVASAAACFAQGTRIRVMRAHCIVEVAVEDLHVGDEVVTSGGATRAIVWLGHRIMNCRSHPRPSDVMPIRIVENAFGEGRPERDLIVSPGHAICVDVLGEILIPAAALVNGATVHVQDVERIIYWHVELAAHDILFAEGLAAESYIDMDNRVFFASEGVVALAAVPDTPRITHANFCRDFHADGALVDAVRSQLVARARHAGWKAEPLDPDLHLLVDGKRVDPSWSGLTATFMVGELPNSLCIASRTCVPAEMSVSHDRRRLGVQIRDLMIWDGTGHLQSISIADPELIDGFHHVESVDGAKCRWTSDQSFVPETFWRSMEGRFFLRVELVDKPYFSAWAPPAPNLAGQLLDLKTA